MAILLMMQTFFVILCPIYCYIHIQRTALSRQSNFRNNAFACKYEPKYKSNTKLFAKGLGTKGSDEMYVCQECGAEHVKWVGKCTSCQTWNSVKAFRPAKELFTPSGTHRIVSTASWVSPPNVATKTSSYVSAQSATSQTSNNAVYSSNGNNDVFNMKDIDILNEKGRLKIAFSNELNRVFGGGIVYGSVVLCAGEPGIGKSTLFMQLASSIASSTPSSSVVYVSGEENMEQIALRARRLRLPVDNIFLICNIDVDYVIESILTLPRKPSLIIVDSVQTLRLASCSGSPGSVSQIKESAMKFVQLAKTSEIPVICLGHVTKSGDVAGPRVLEHMVDAVLFLEENNDSSSYFGNSSPSGIYSSSSGSSSSSSAGGYRMLRSIKNRFGSSSEMGILSMTAAGMVDVTDPSEVFLSSQLASSGVEGSAASVTLQGSRSLVAEIQCLVGDFKPAAMKSMSRRGAEGFSLQRLLLICAVIEKRLKISLYNRDIYVNIVGGLRLQETTNDLAVAVALISSLVELKVKPGTVFMGEIGLNGEIRNSGKKVDQRIQQASQLGFHTIITGRFRSKSDTSSGASNNQKGLFDVVECNTLGDVLKVALDGDYEAVINQRKNKYKSMQKKLKSNQAFDNKTDSGGRKLYSPEEEAWMTDDTELLLPSRFMEDEEEEESN